MAATPYDAPLHLLSARELCKRAHCDWDIQHRNIAAAPEDACPHVVTNSPVDDDLVNQGSQQRLLAGGAQERTMPQLGQLLSEIEEGCAQLLGDLGALVAAQPGSGGARGDFQLRLEWHYRRGHPAV